MFNNSFYTDTIIAQCTPTGTGALALLRISGPNSLKSIAQCSLLSSKKLLLEVPSHTVHHGWIINGQEEIIDEVMFIVMHAPRTFTGETTVEITCHNNQFIIESIIQLIISCGVRLAYNGEFSRQAVLNNKINLTQAEAINDLINANSQQSLKRSLAQIKGSLSNWLEILEKDILKVLALCEASFEFLEEDIDFGDQIRTDFANILSKIKSLANSTQQNHLREGIRIAIIGSVNAGKSSLFNALLGKNRSIVAPIAGTTRDVIEASFYSEGLYWTFIDTAGLRQTNDVIEREGIDRSHQEARGADLILLVIDNSRKMTLQEEIIYTDLIKLFSHKIIIIKNKSDLPCSSVNQPDFLKLHTTFNITIKNLETIALLKNEINSQVKKLLNNNTCPFLLNKRQSTLLAQCQSEIEVLISNATYTIEYEIMAHHLRNILEMLSELTGRSINEKMLDTIFKEFCIGK